jgi:hypothetical protein
MIRAMKLLVAVVLASSASAAGSNQKGQHMAQQEIRRKTHVQWMFPLPIAINVIDEITFIDPTDQYWQTTFTFDNADQASRTVRVVGFTNYPTDPVPPTLPLIKVEVVQKAKVLDKKERAQEFWYTFRDNDNPSDPPIHLKTHVTTIIKNLTTQFPYTDNLDDLYAGGQIIMAIERVDQISFVDPTNQYWETIYKLDWTDDEIKNDKNLIIPQKEYDDIISEAERTGANPTLRLDPFQNIIGISTKRHMAHVHLHVDEADPGDRPSGFALTDTVAGPAGLLWEDDPPGFYGPLSPDWNYDDPISLDALQTWRFTFDGTKFLSGMYPSTKLTKADKGQKYISRIGEVTTERLLVNEGNAGEDPNKIDLVETITTTQTGEYFAQWAMFKVSQ